MLTLQEAIGAIQHGNPIEIPYTTRKGCRGIARRIETEEYWITVSVSEKPVKAWLDRLIEEALPNEPWTTSNGKCPSTREPF